MRNVLSAVLMFAVLLAFVAFWIYTAIKSNVPPSFLAVGAAVSAFIIIAGLRRFLRRTS